MKLNQDHMDQLWGCLTSDSNLRCADVLFQWIYQQAVGDDFHGVDDELLDYVLKCKLPTLPPEHFRLRGLKLLEQLLWIRQDYECCHELEHPATRLLWDIALKAVDDEVSMSAIRILNHFYIYTNHQKPVICKQGTNFMRYCMEHLQSSLVALKSCENLKETNHSLEVMQKVILLIRTHLEVFKAHWSYYLRILQLNLEADLISHRLNAYDIKLTMTIRLVIQAASSMNKTTIEVQATDFIGELRAMIVNWWYRQVDQGYFEGSDSPSQSSTTSSTAATTSSSASAQLLVNDGDQEDLVGVAEDNRQVSRRSGTTTTTTTTGNSAGSRNNRLDGFTTFLLNNHHSLRLLSQNQEIPFDWDERQVNELDFKDMQIIYVLNDVKPPNQTTDSADDLESEKGSTEEPAAQVYLPELNTIPSIVLQGQENFECLMEVDRFLGLFQSPENVDLTIRAKTLSRRVWEIIQILPTSPHYKENLKHCGLDNDHDMNLKVPKCSNILNADCPQRLLYSLQIIDILKSSPECPFWGSTFIRKDGLADLYDVFMSQKLLPDDDEEWNEWLQECLAYLLKLLFQFGTRTGQSPLSANNVAAAAAAAAAAGASTDQHGSTSGVAASKLNNNNLGQANSRMHGERATVSSVKRLRRNRNRFHSITEERVLIPQFSGELLRLLEDTNKVFDKLIRILKSSAFCKSQNDYYYVTISSRAMIVHHSMSFLSSWCKSDPKFPEIQIQNYEHLLKALILDDTDPATRREACNGFFKLHYACLNRSIGSNIHHQLDTSTSSESPPAGDNNSDTSSIGTGLSVSGDSSVVHLLSNSNFSADLLTCLIKFLPIAEGMKPPKPIRNCVSESEYLRELNTPGCKDYFWLTCRLIDAPNTCGAQLYRHYQQQHHHQQQQQQQQQQPQQHRRRRRTPSRSSDDFNLTGSSDHLGQAAAPAPPPAMEGGAVAAEADNTMNESRRSSSSPSFYASNPGVDLPDLCKYLMVAIRNRPTYETRDYTVEDDTLRGMLMMMVMAIRRDATFRYTDEALQFILELYSYLFAPPTEQCRFLPKCKSGATRSTAFDLMIALVEHCPRNYMLLLNQLLNDQHQAVVKGSYPTDYWPHDDCRSEVGFVGLINLGATCYLATCMQHLFMIPDLRYAILSIQDPKSIRHGEIIRELQKIFAFMLESERKAYNPRNFCKVYTMDNHPLNIAEQTDMTEFLTDLITKIEESSPVLRQIIKSLFSGTLSNNVVSLDCPHISRTTEEFYTLRVQVADMRNLNDSLDELTVKDTLEGDNMYTCSTCEKKVRAEKRACIVKLPRILCFNTMRYTFNMTTMTKEKVNTHFSFPLKLDMADYLEANLMKRQQLSPNSSNCPSRNSSGSMTGDNHMPQAQPQPPPTKTVGGCDDATKLAEQEAEVDQKSPTCSSSSSSSSSSFNENNSPTGGDDEKMQEDSGNGEPNGQNSQHSDRSSKEGSQLGDDSDTMYELIGVTVHTGNADGGHYYCFIRDCEDNSTDKPRWYLFNDAEVKPFDDSHIGTECYGGELTTKSYDAINDRFMDFSIEKTNSAYMLFYKRVDYKYRSKSVALRYLESDTERNLSGPTTTAAAASVRCNLENIQLMKQQHMASANNNNLQSSGQIKLGQDNQPVVVNTDQSSPPVTESLSFTTTTTTTISEINNTESTNVKSTTTTAATTTTTTTTSNSKVTTTQSQLSSSSQLQHDDRMFATTSRYNAIFNETTLDFDKLVCQLTYDDFVLPRHLANWIWTDNLKFSRDQCIFEHNYFDFMWQICANVPRTHNIIPRSVATKTHPSHFLSHSEDTLAIETVHLAIIFVLGVLMNSRERPNLSNWTELIRKQFNSSRAACDWLMQLIDDDETWLKQMLLRCPIEMVRQLFQRLCNDLTGASGSGGGGGAGGSGGGSGKQHKKIRLVK